MAVRYTASVSKGAVVWSFSKRKPLPSWRASKRPSPPQNTAAQARGERLERRGRPKRARQKKPPAKRTNSAALFAETPSLPRRAATAKMLPKAARKITRQAEARARCQRAGAPAGAKGPSGFAARLMGADSPCRPKGAGRFRGRPGRRRRRGFAERRSRCSKSGCAAGWRWRQRRCL